MQVWVILKCNLCSYCQLKAVSVRRRAPPSPCTLTSPPLRRELRTLSSNEQAMKPLTNVNHFPALVLHCQVTSMIGVRCNCFLPWIPNVLCRPMCLHLAHKVCKWAVRRLFTSMTYEKSYLSPCKHEMLRFELWDRIRSFIRCVTAEKIACMLFTFNILRDIVCFRLCIVRSRCQ